MLRMEVYGSEDIEGVDAARELVAKVQAAFSAVPPSCLLFFTSLLDADYQEMLDIFTVAFPGTPLIGCTTDGELSSALGQSDDSSILICFASDTVHFSHVIIEEISALEGGALTAACQAARDLLWEGIPAGEEAKLCLGFPDGLVAYQKPLVRRMAGVLGDVPFFGGAAADDYKFFQTMQFYNGKVHRDTMPLLLLSGEISFSFGVAHGWNPVSQLARVTRSDFNKVYEIDGMPVLEYYQRYIGDSMNMTPGIYAHFALIVLDMEGGGSYLRDLILPVPEEGALIFAGEVPEGAVVRLAEIGRDELVEAAEKSIGDAMADYSGGQLAGALVFSCASRRNILGSRVVEECQACQKIISQTIPVGGFYGFGEIAPIGRHGKAILHNDTFVVVLLGGVRSDG